MRVVANVAMAGWARGEERDVKNSPRIKGLIANRMVRKVDEGLPVAEPPVVQPEPEPAAPPLASVSMTVPELRKLAADAGVAVPAGATKLELLDLLEAADVGDDGADS